VESEFADVRHLQLFDLLYQLRSVTRAATRLGLSQPTASIWLGQLRDRLNDPLFVRTPGGMAPTPRADSLIGPCREILESLRRFTDWEVSFDPTTAQRRFRICMTDASHITLLPAVLAHVRAYAPGIQLVAARIDQHTEHALQTGEADLAIGYVPWLGDNIRGQELYPQDWVCLADRNHPRVGDRLDVDRYLAEGHVAVAAGTGGHLLQQALARERIDRRIVLELSGFLGLGVVIRTTDLLVTLPRHIGETLATTNGLAVHDCPFPVDGFAVAQHWHPRYHQDPGNRWLRGFVAGLFGRFNPG
jgi:DNA-binding transcriptional LysR family regulator